MNKHFEFISISPAGVPHPGIALAAVRAGGMGLLDMEFCPSPEIARKNLDKFLGALGKSEGKFGIRLDVNQAEEYHGPLETIAQRNHHLLLCRVEVKSLKRALKRLPLCSSRMILLEITSFEQAQALADSGFFGSIAGIVAKGNECGGWVGEDTAFILAQKLASLKSFPFFVQGVGVHSAAACRIIGARGVVMDDQLLLMPESSIPPEWKEYLARCDGQETILIGERLGKPCRVFSPPGYKTADILEKLAEKVEDETGAIEGAEADWRERAGEYIGWDSPEKKAWPIGQTAGLASRYLARYKNTARLIQALLRESERHIASAASVKPLAPGSPLAAAHKTRRPIVQGPMSRVSDRPEFISAVAEAGALPMLALGTMTGQMAGELLAKTREKLGASSWGVGLIGFIPQEMYREQVERVVEYKPAAALIAGGRPDQAVELESAGIPTYLHVPTPELLKLYYENGARRFVFEGRECGGHLGPLSSFILWENAVNTLLDIVPQKGAEEVNILFAGGIHDALSAAAVSVIAAPLAERGMKIGVIVGTAYLFTREIVETGAIVEEFQRRALECRKTINIVVGPGHSNRCADSPFTKEFYAARKRMMAEGKPADEIRTSLDLLTMGRLTVAAKGVVIDEKGNAAQVDKETQVKDGLYLIGQLATMREGVIGMEDLHREISEGSTEMLEKAEVTELKVVPETLPAPSDIAIIGMSVLLPKAQTLEKYWENIVRNIDVITEIPPERFDWRLYYDPDRNARDKIYAKWGGFIDDVPFDPMYYGIPPNALKSTDPMQLMTLEAVRLALVDAGYGDGDFDKENTSIIMGAVRDFGDMGVEYALRAELPRFVEAPSELVWDRLPEWTEASFNGILGNIISSRVANRFDLGGTSFTVDAACATSIASVEMAVRELESGRSNMVITGGVDLLQNPFTYICFSKSQALSPQGKARPFDKKADGIVISEGVTAIILKRLKDAERDGDKIYAVIKGIGSSSDGRSGSLYAPDPGGQQLALKRAYRKAGITPLEVEYFEAHGTGTTLGDESEAETLVSVLKGENAPPKSVVVSSVKAQMGHTKTSAGASSIIKAALALRHKTLPPHMNVDDPIDPFADAESPVYLLKEARPWIGKPGHPRRAGVSAFGFGGTNFHAVLEEYPGSPQSAVDGSLNWSYELFVFRADNKEELAGEVSKLIDSLKAGAQPRLRDLSYSLAVKAAKNRLQPVCLSVVTDNLSRLADNLKTALEHIAGKSDAVLPPHIQIGTERIAPDAKIAFVYPGQGSQYPNMLREAALYFPEVRESLEFADAQLRKHYPQFLSQYIFPPSPFSEEEDERNKQRLIATHVAQTALAAVENGLLNLAARLGIHPDMVCGHSLGENVAQFTAGIFSRQNFLRLIENRSRIMEQSTISNPGTMAAIQLPREELEKRIEGIEDMVIANHNAPLQSIISGYKQPVADIVEKLNGEGILARLLPVAGAFHSPLFQHSYEPFKQAIADMEFYPPKIPIYSNVTSNRFPEDTEKIRDLISRHLLEPVEFMSIIEHIYEDGARIFIEPGPKSVLTNLVNQILEGREHIAVSFDGEGGGLRGFLIALGTLAAKGFEFDLPALFEGRDVRVLSLTKLAETTSPKPLPASVWLVNGGSVRPHKEPVGYPGKIPTLNKESAEEARKNYIAKLAGERGAVSAPAQPGAQAPPIQIPPFPSPPPQTAAGSVEALQLYQETMRQFLALQERVMSQFLGGQPVSIPAQQPLPYEVKPITEREESPESVPDEKPQPAAAKAFTRDDAAGSLLKVIAEHTGYPEDMLGMDLDMEADLGIDSIKRVEILGALQKTLPEAVQSAVKDQMDTFTRVKTMSQLVEKLMEVGGEIPAAAVPPPAAAEKAFSRDEAAGSLLKVIAEHTGYPEDMLGMDLDMEADLGIDSIKRVEILGALQKTLPDAIQSAVKDMMDAFTRVKTMSQLIDKLMELKSAPESPGESAEEAQPEPVSFPPSEETPRYIMAPVDELPPEPEAEKLSGLYLITQDELSVAQVLADELRKKGADPALIDAAALRNPEKLRQSLEKLRAERGPVKGIVHLAALADKPLPDSLTEWRGLSQIHSKSLFTLLRAFADDLRQYGGAAESKLLAVSMLGGYFGRRGDGVGGIPTAGGITGMLKTMMMEWPQLSAKSLDFDNSLSPAEISDKIVRELLSSRGSCEIGFPRGKKIAFKLNPAPLVKTEKSAPIVPDKDWVALVIGGARGITAEIAGVIAPAGLTLVLVGRTPLRPEEDSETRGVDDIARLRKHFMEKMKREGAAFTPAAVEKEIQGLFRKREILANMEHFKACGAKVEYISADVTDEEQFGALIEDLYSRYGRLDAVLHGAGIIEDKLIVDKSDESFARVFDTKVDSVFILSKYLKSESLKLFLLFSSMAGRYGNRGQVDYAAANEVLNRFAWRLDRMWKNTRVMSVNWGPWDLGEKGMVTTEVRRQFHQRGIIPVTPEVGSRFFSEELEFGRKGDVEIIVGDGPWREGKK